MLPSGILSARTIVDLGPHRVQVARRDLLHVRVALGDDEQGAVAGHCFLDGAQRALAPDE